MTRLRYSENPTEWRKLVWSSSLAVCLAVCLGARQGKWGWSYAAAFGIVAVAAILGSWIRPEAFRGWYRTVRWAGHQIGKVMGRVLLLTVFCLVVWPTGLVMRLLGKVPLDGRPDPRTGTYWSESGPTSELDRLF